MTVKKFMKKVNRGLVLALVLILVMGSYIAVDEARFKKEKPQIVQTLNEYMADLGKVMNTPEEYRKLGKAIPQEALSEQKKELEEVANRYWISGSSGSENYYYTETYLREWLNSIYAIMEENSTGDGFISSWNCRIEGSPKIYKNGSDAATVEVQFTLTTEYTGKVSIPGPDGYTPMSGYEMTEDQQDKAMRLTLNGSLNFEFERVDGSWRIKTTTGAGYDFSQPVPVEEE